MSLPPRLAGYTPAVPPALAADTERALREIAALDHTHGEHLASLSGLLLRAEAVASSKIESIEASVEDFARAEHGIRSNAAANDMLSAARSIRVLIDSADSGADLELGRVLEAHRMLMESDPTERDYAGRLRDVQNWIGGSDYSPRGSLYVPPPPETVADYMSDLLAFANRDDMSVLAQATVVHAQFESIHPFTDGNGRIGRALINAVLRRRGSTRRVAVPLASAVVARRRDYFDQLEAYRLGDAAPLMHSFTSAAFIASVESQETAHRLSLLPDRWRDEAGSPRAGSAARRILDGLLARPIFSADEAEMWVRGSTSSIYEAINRLEESGVLRPLTSRRRNQIWVAADLADELNDLGVRIADRAAKEL